MRKATSRMRSIKSNANDALAILRPLVPIAPDTADERTIQAVMWALEMIRDDAYDALGIPRGPEVIS